MDNYSILIKVDAVRILQRIPTSIVYNFHSHYLSQGDLSGMPANKNVILCETLNPK